jgi:hypothetical protein
MARGACRAASLTACRVACTLTVVLMAADAVADWQMVQDTTIDATRGVDVAYVENDAGNTLQIYRDADGVIQGILSLRGGFRRFAAHLCPSYRVDANPPAKLVADETTCQVEPQRVRFALGESRGGLIRSTLLLQLMNGAAVVFRYRLANTGYAQTTFTLGGSKGALQAVLGTLRVVPRR